MQRRPKLWISFAPVEGDFTIDDKAWERIESAYRKPMPPATRKAMLKATQWFLSREKFERAAVTVAETVSTVERCKRSASEFLDSLPTRRNTSDANGYGKSFIREYWCHGLPSDRLEDLCDLDASADPFEELCDLVTSFRSACDAALKELQNDKAEDSFKEGEAWDEWIRRADHALRKARLKVSARGDKGVGERQSPFVELVWELQKCLPAGARRHTNSRPALASAIKKALKGTPSKNRARKRPAARR